MATLHELREALDEAKAAVEAIPNGEIKTKAFEVILQHLLNTKLTNRAETIRGVHKQTRAKRAENPPKSNGETMVDHTAIVTQIKTCGEAEAIEENVLSQNKQIDRTLLPLYIVHSYFENGFGLTSGDINKITNDLGIPIATANASKTLSGTAKGYVIGDTLRKKGGVVRYKLHKRGVDYMKLVIAGVPDEVQK